MRPELHIDVETHSVVDLKKTGVYRYAEDSTTDLWCASYKFKCDHQVEKDRWLPDEHFVQPDIIQYAVKERARIVAHNAQFERVIWEKILGPQYGWLVPELEDFDCTMVRCFAMGLPGSLDDAAKALNLKHEKDAAGHRLMLQMAKPRRMEGNKPIWWDDEDRKQRLFAYCDQDVVVEELVDEKVLPLTANEKKIYIIDQKMNAKGVMVDLNLCEKLQTVAEDATVAATERAWDITDGMVTSLKAPAQITKWLATVGVNTKSVDAENIDRLLSEGHPEEVEEILLLRKAVSKSSIAKLTTFQNWACADGKIRGTLQYGGAARTLRWAGRGPQLQNLPRPSLEIEDIDFALECVAKGEPEGIRTIDALNELEIVSSCLRSMLTSSHGNELETADYSNIEGRVLAWLAGEEPKLQAFREYDAGTGPDIYLKTASNIFGVPVSEAKPYRQIGGKVPELALGFQGGAGAFITMAKTYGFRVADQYDTVWKNVSVEIREEVEDAWDLYGYKMGIEKVAWHTAEAIKRPWRYAHPAIEAFWHGLEKVSIKAVENPGKEYTYKGLNFSNKGGFLCIRLHSGRRLFYSSPQVKTTMKFGKQAKALSYMGQNTYTRRWERISTYGGKLAENITQASAREVMALAMIRMDPYYEFVLTVHDELITEEPLDKVNLNLFFKRMAQVPKCYAGLPISVGGWQGTRYRKD